MSGPSHELDDVVAFGPFQLFRQRRHLLRDGQAVQLGSRALDLLIVLVERAGELVTKEELIARVWPNTHVEEVALRVHLTALRKVLSEGRPDARDLVNVPGRGYQLVAPISSPRILGKTSAAAAPAAGDRQSALPPLFTRVIGRDLDLDIVISRLAAKQCVTITGAGGIGKTTLGLAAAHRIAAQVKDGAFFVDLAPLSGPGHVLNAVATAVGAPNSGDIAAARLAEFLAPKEALLVIDNCEHVLAEVSDIVSSVIAGAAKIRVLATSREPLHVPAQSIYRLPTLATPPDIAGLSAKEAIAYPAIELFIERAATVSDRFVMDDRSAPIVAGICSQLDGLALAIEMAATRLDKFGVADIAAMLDDRFRVLRRSRRQAGGRHTSLSTTLDWSYDMLQDETRVFFHRISSFSGRFTLEDATQVAAGLSRSRGEVVEWLADLVDKSFLTVDLNDAMAMYRLYETMREYGRKQSLAAGDWEETRRQHALYFMELFARADGESEAQSTTEWLRRYGRYLDDIRSALDWCFGVSGDVEAGISLTASAVPLWVQLSFLDELYKRVVCALDKAGSTASQGGRREMKLFAALSYASVNLYGPTPQGTSACRSALEIARKIGDFSTQARALLALWNGCFTNGEVRLSLVLAEEFMSVASKLGHADVLVGHRMLGSSYFYLGDVGNGRKHMEIMVAGYGSTAHDAHMTRFGFGQLASGRGLLALHLCFQGLLDQAMEATRRSAGEAIESNHAMTICGVLGTTSITNCIYTGHLDEAREYLGTLLKQARAHGLRRWENFGIGFEGVVLFREGKLKEGLAKLSQSVAQADDRANTRYMMIFSEYALAVGCAGNPAQGLATIDEILLRLTDTGERWYLPELFRTRARLLHAQGEEPAEVEANYRRALSLSAEIDGLLWRLLAARDFAKFLCEEGRLREAIEVLETTCALFSEGQGCPEFLSTRRYLGKLADQAGQNRRHRRGTPAAELCCSLDGSGGPSRRE